MGYRLGVDLGTTFTAAAMRNGGPPSMLGLGNRALQIPSVLYLQEDGQFLVGEAAERRGATDPSRVVREFKRRIGDPIPLMVAGTPFSAQALSARLLSSVVATATERRGAPPDEIVLTYPANWGAYKRELVDQVISLADIGPTVTCPEPQAAAIQYAAQAQLQAGDRVAVYDLGGGTFDVCVLEKTSSGFVILGNPEGIEQLGGVDFDEAVFQHVVGALGPAMEDLDLDSPEGRTALTRLRRDCVEAKEALSVDVDTMIPVTLPGRSTSVRLTRAELETLIAPALEQTVEATGRALRAAGTTTDQLKAIVLVGGSSRIPLVSHLLQSRFSTPTALDTHPKHDIALGAVQFTEAPSTTQLAAVGDTRTQAAVAAGAGGVAGAAGVAAGGAAGTPAGLLPKPARKPLPPQTRRLVAFVAGGVAVLAIGVFAAIQLLSGDGDSGRAAGSGTGPTVPAKSVSPSLTPSNSAPTGPTLKALPAAAVPLSASELIIPLKISTDEDLYVADANNPAEKTRITTLKGNDSVPSISPDRRSVVFRHSAEGQKDSLWVVGTDGSQPRALFTKRPAECADSIGRPGWNSKAPSQLVVPCRAGKTTGLYLVDTDGRLLHKIFSKTGDGFIVSDPAVSTDGARVIFEYHEGKQNAMMLATLDGKGQPRRVTSANDSDPAWSPVKPGLLAFRRAETNGGLALYTAFVDGVGAPCDGGQPRPLEVDGVTLCRLTDGSKGDQDPTWAPEGDRFAFKRGRNPSTTIQVMSLDGKLQPKPIWTTNPGSQNAPAWTTR
ncbi:Hsp70 family protein [Kribbella sp. NPDC006257]|uniref:Hsp70 family protein n=1 Tax=Kribbella sp. NPDC006257 TaxID=3156738 RepID=UPI0033BE775D